MWHPSMAPSPLRQRYGAKCGTGFRGTRSSCWSARGRGPDLSLRRSRRTVRRPQVACLQSVDAGLQTRNPVRSPVSGPTITKRRASQGSAHLPHVARRGPIAPRTAPWGPPVSLGAARGISAAEAARIQCLPVRHGQAHESLLVLGVGRPPPMQPGHRDLISAAQRPKRCR